jgi:hypothetical protein
MATVSQAPTASGASYLFGAVQPQDVLTREDMGEEERMMARSLKEYAAQHVFPNADAIEARDWSVIGPLVEKAAELGLFMAEVPEEYGGLNLSVLAIAAMMEGRSDMGPISSTLYAHQGIGTLPLVNFGTPEQIDKYLESCMNGTRLACFALTEPSSGSDAMNIRTTAVLNDEGTHYIVNGSKQWITNAGWAKMMILFAKVDGTKFTAFILDADTPGLTVAANEDLLGLRSSSVCGLTLENVAIPVENVLGEIGRGHKVALCTLNLGRLKMATNCAGGGKKALACAANYAAERLQFGQPIANFGVIQLKLANMAARVYAAESNAYRTAGLVYDKSEAMRKDNAGSLEARLSALSEFSIECALSKVFGAEMVNALSDEALQTHGGYGFSEEYAPAKMYRDWRVTRIYEGTSEICRMSSMKAMLKRGSQGALDLHGAIDSAKAAEPDAAGRAPKMLQDALATVANLKALFQRMLGAAFDNVGQEALLNNDRQPVLGALAMIATEIYAVESGALRVLKIRERHSDEATRIPELLVWIYLDRAARKIRESATEIVTDVFDDPDSTLQDIERWLPIPRARRESRQEVVTYLTSHAGELPEIVD